MERSKPAVIYGTAFLLGVLLLFVLWTAARGNGFDASAPIVVVTREEGSGTRSSFTEALGITHNGVDTIDVEAVTVGGSATVLAAVRSDCEAIGYIPARLANTSDVRTVALDGVLPTASALRSGEYPLCRPLTLAMSDTPSESAADLFRYIFSKEGQALIERLGYAPCGEMTEAQGIAEHQNRLSICCSATAAPLVKKLIDAWKPKHPEISIEMHRTDTASAMMMMFSDTCDIAVASRALTDEEQQRCVSSVFALEGIAVVVNENNPVDSLTGECLRQIYTGGYSSWDEVIGDGD